MNPRVLLSLAVLIASSFLASGASGAPFKFGSKLDSTVQPSNADSPRPCIDEDGQRGARCTWVMTNAYGRPNRGHKAGRRGTITKLRLIAGAPGSFRLQIARVRADGTAFEAKVVRNGPKIQYSGQPDPNEPYVVEKFSVNVPVRRGDRLAIRTAKTSTLRCSGDAGALVFRPPLDPNGPYRASTDDYGCYLLLEAVVRPAG